MGLSHNHASKTSKPQPRTAIGRLSYEFDNLPSLFIIDLKIQKSADIRSASIGGHKILKVVVEKWLAEAGLANWARRASIKYSAGPKKARVSARTAIRFDNSTELEGLRPRIKNVPKHMKLYIEKVSKDGVRTDFSVHCRVNDIKDETDEVAYRESLTHLLREASRQSGYLSNYPQDPKIVSSCLPGSVDEASHGSWFRVNVRMEPRVDVEERLIYIDFDLVPVISETSAENLLHKLLGTSAPTGKIVEKNLPTLQHTLRGLRARLIYKPLPRTSANRANIQILSEEQVDREIQIQDVKLHGDPTFVMGEAEDGVAIRAEDYFSEGNYPHYVLLKSRG